MGQHNTNGVLETNLEDVNWGNDSESHPMVSSWY